MREKAPGMVLFEYLVPYCDCMLVSSSSYFVPHFDFPVVNVNIEIII